MLENIKLFKANQSNLLVLFKIIRLLFAYSIIFQDLRCLWTKDFR